jgi:aryl-alcohol dehydrogenase-like predicted oxidoreductase
MEKRALGETGLSLSTLGFGGFHLVEIPSAEASRLLHSYLDRGGNYIETAAEYGNGVSEEKIGRAVAHRRGDYVLATKTLARTREASAAEIDRSLRLLQTDHVDVLFLHCVQTAKEIETIFGPGGAMEAVLAARKAGKARFIGITGHGRPDGLLAALPLHPFDVVMTGFNYFDRFNFPAVEEVLLPRLREAGIGIVAMKALADGYLFRSAGQAIRWTLGLPVATVVMGINTMEMLDADIRAVRSSRPMTDREKEKLYRTAPELGDYVCRLCGKCVRDGFDPQAVFLLEGLLDRQMDDMRVPDPGLYALRERLKGWFAQGQVAREEYAALAARVDPAADYGGLSKLCPYGIDVDRKLKIAHGKLSAGYVY